MAISSFTLHPDKCIDVAVKLGLSLRWVLDSANGGVSGIEMLAQARRAVEADDASNVMILSADHFAGSDFRELLDNYNLYTQQYLSDLGIAGPNPLFALITSAQMKEYGITKEVYGKLVTYQRDWAGKNERALYRSPITIEEYFEAPIISTPLSLLDCVPVASGGEALIISSAKSSSEIDIRIRALKSMYNFDSQLGSGLHTGLQLVAAEFWRESGKQPSAVDVVSTYDDYPAMTIAQLIDLGFIDGENVATEIDAIVAGKRFALNTSGGQLSAGQAGAAGGLHGLVEVVRQLAGLAGIGQIVNAKVGLATGYGMVAYRYGACSNSVLLEVGS
jgi:acetyl-CoA acetyltransferase